MGNLIGAKARKIREAAQKGDLAYLKKVKDKDEAGFKKSQNEKSQDDSMTGCTALMLACHGPRPEENEGGASLEVCEFLIECGADLDAETHHGMNALKFAVGCDTHRTKHGSYRGQIANLPIVKLLIKCGAKQHAQCEWDGSTLLHYACEHVEIEVVEYLLEHSGDSLNVQDKWGKSPLLHCLSRWGQSFIHARLTDQLKIVRLLVDNGEEVDGLDNYGRTPLMNAIRDMQVGPQMIKLLVELGANVKYTDDSNNTVLSLLANPQLTSTSKKKNPCEIIKLLVELGADVNHTNGRESILGEFKHYWSRSQQFGEIVECLKALGAKE